MVSQTKTQERELINFTKKGVGPLENLINLNKNMKKAILILSIAGLIFAGYLSGVKFFSGSCALGEGCPYFLGYPACYFGFAMYLLLTIYALILVFGKDGSIAVRPIKLISFLGILFAGSFTIGEIPLLFDKGFGAFALGLPTCALGLIFYVTIFRLVMKIRSK